MVILSLAAGMAFGAAAALRIVPCTTSKPPACQPIQKPSSSPENLPEDLVDAVDRLVPQKSHEKVKPSFPASQEWDEPGAIRPA